MNEHEHHSIEHLFGKIGRAMDTNVAPRREVLEQEYNRILEELGQDLVAFLSFGIGLVSSRVGTSRADEICATIVSSLLLAAPEAREPTEAAPPAPAPALADPWVKLERIAQLYDAWKQGDEREGAPSPRRTVEAIGEILLS
jgi:hypothetical protein